ncbi:MAG TPA: DoxX family protein [Ktedonobacteraceae bacterium]
MKEDMTMKIKVISYWVTTIFTVLELLAGGVTDLMHGRTALVAGEPVAEVLVHLGYPVYLLTILGVWKLLGAIALLAPRLPRLKEWAYAGSFFVYAGAFVSGMIRGFDDSSTFIWPPLIFAVLTLASWALRPQSRILGVLFPEKLLT